ncbi:unnamed protein product [Aspergillus oryzae]|uniref:Unnamed protein product n=1 Tax=Aspergillus oryzae TaxID=5062 RepID=A0AAN5BRF3_ASPOZ|nr:unnamed protein product [Aspergillus oryzae]GMF85372.1 unnamed protein product [Aspergillus oryzae]GMG23330.1 unnamed protein product [Aspergillus oryzae]
MVDTFSSIPIVDFRRLQDPLTKAEALEQLREAIFQVGFLYLINHGLEYPDHPGAKELVENYIAESAKLSQEFMRYVSECLSLPPTTFESFKGKMDRLKFIRYPQAAPGSQGVGPHKDSTGLFTFLSQDDTGGLQVLNKNGEWIDAPPIEGSLVVNIQQGFEAITGGICTATTHRVIVCWSCTDFVFCQLFLTST